MVKEKFPTNILGPPSSGPPMWRKSTSPPQELERILIKVYLVHFGPFSAIFGHFWSVFSFFGFRFFYLDLQNYNIVDVITVKINNTVKNKDFYCGT